MTNTEQIRTKKISFILALSVIIFAAITTYFTLCHDINIMRITTPVILGLAMSIILCGVLQKFFYNWLTKNPIHFSFGEQSSPVIESEGTKEPVCIAETLSTEQLADSSYYLKLDENGEYAMWGCYYAHCENEIGGRDKLDKNTTVFGHSASNCDPDGVRFTKLYRYMDADFVKEHPYIYLSVDGEDMIFQITALFVTDIGFDYIEPDPAGDDLTSFFETIARKNWLDFDGVTFSEEDTVLTLSTCCRKYDKANSGNQRLVVMAKLLPEGATAQEFSVSVMDSPEMP